LISVLQRRVLERHFHDLQKKYGAVVAIDLVNTVSTELLNFQLTHASIFKRKKTFIMLLPLLVGGFQYDIVLFFKCRLNISSFIEVICILTPIVYFILHMSLLKMDLSYPLQVTLHV
jgi:accessory gene regulator protein AgrB